MDNALYGGHVYKRSLFIIFKWSSEDEFFFGRNIITSGAFNCSDTWRIPYWRILKCDVLIRGSDAAWWYCCPNNWGKKSVILLYR